MHASQLLTVNSSNSSKAIIASIALTVSVGNCRCPARSHARHVSACDRAGLAMWEIMLKYCYNTSSDERSFNLYKTKENTYLSLKKLSTLVKILNRDETVRNHTEYNKHEKIIVY